MGMHQINLLLLHKSPIQKLPAFLEEALENASVLRVKQQNSPEMQCNLLISEGECYTAVESRKKIPFLRPAEDAQN